MKTTDNAHTNRPDRLLLGPKPKYIKNVYYVDEKLYIWCEFSDEYLLLT